MVGNPESSDAPRKLESLLDPSGQGYDEETGYVEEVLNEARQRVEKVDDIAGRKRNGAAETLVSVARELEDDYASGQLLDILRGDYREVEAPEDAKHPGPYPAALD